MENEIKLQEEKITEEDVKDYLLGSWTKLTDNQFKMFRGISKAFNLNPFKREIYAIPYERNVKDETGKRIKVPDMSLVTWYQVYIDKAMKSWMLDWWNVDIIRKEDWKIEWAKIVIYRKDWKMPFEWFVWIKEFVKLKNDWSPMWSWATMPEFMIKKVAIWQWFRLAFPNELSWMPYLSEEITDKKEDIKEEILMEWFEKKEDLSDKETDNG